MVVSTILGVFEMLGEIIMVVLVSKPFVVIFFCSVNSEKQSKARRQEAKQLSFTLKEYIWSIFLKLTRIGEVLEKLEKFNNLTQNLQKFHYGHVMQRLKYHKETTDLYLLSMQGFRKASCGI